MKPPLLQNVIALTILVALIITLFAGMALYRVQAYGEQRTVHAWFSDLTLQFARNWHRDGVIALRGALFWRPASPEFPDLASRRMHSSYPSGLLVPVYAAALITFSEPAPGHVFFATVFCHFLLILCCAFIVFLFTLRAKGRPVDACGFACVPVVLLCFLPAPFYYFDKCYFAYEAVLPLIALYMLLEMLRESSLSETSRKWIRGVQYGVAFIGVFTEWLFLLFGAMIFLKRLFSCELGRHPMTFLKNVFLFWLPYGLALLLFVIQVLTLGGFAYIQNRFLLRTGITGNIFLEFSKLNPFWERHIYPMFGATGITALLVCAGLLILFGIVLIFFRIFGRSPEPCLRAALWIGLAAIIPCVLHVELLRQQSSFFLHGFEALKFSIPLALLPLGLLPLALLRLFGLNWSQWTLHRIWLPSPVPLVAVILAVGYVYLMFPDIEKRYAGKLPPSDKTNIARASFLDKNTNEQDVVFSSAVHLAQTDAPFYAAYSMKLVYEAHSLYDVYEKVRPIESPYTVCFFNPETKPEKDAALAELIAQGETVGSFEAITLKRISKEELMAAYKEQ